MARPRFHALTSLAGAALAYRRWGPGAALGLVAGGLFVDLDHLADYVWVRRRGRRTEFFAPLHSWELVAAGTALAFWLRRRRHAAAFAAAPKAAPGEETLAPDAADGEPPAERDRPGDGERVLLGLLAGLVLHLVPDVIANRPRHAGVYSVLYRMRHRFDRDGMGWEDHTSFHEWSGKPWYTWV
jgi:hypothetical protein